MTDAKRDRARTQNKAPEIRQAHPIRWLRCVSIDDGMFSNERTIEIKTRGRREQCFLVPLSELDVQKSAVRVKAYLYEGGMWALVPTPQPETIPIAAADLLPMVNEQASGTHRRQA